MPLKLVDTTTALAKAVKSTPSFVTIASPDKREAHPSSLGPYSLNPSLVASAYLNGKWGLSNGSITRVPLIYLQLVIYQPNG